MFAIEPDTERKHESPARELAQGLSGADEVGLLWHPGTDRLELFVRDRATGVGFQLEVAPAAAIDAFYHPYAYAAWRESSDHAGHAERGRSDA